MSDPLLEVEDLRTQFPTERGVVEAVDGVSLRIEPGEIVGLVGESGSGKSVLAESIVGIVEEPGEIVGDDIRLRGESLREKSESELAALRGGELAMVFQDPMNSLNPTLAVGEQIAETVRLHQDVGESVRLPAEVKRKLLGVTKNSEAWRRAIEMLEAVEIPEPESRATDYPHQFSGGMRQRAMIAMALSCEPDLLITDEPTTALDVTIQAQILGELEGLKDAFDTSILMINPRSGGRRRDLRSGERDVRRRDNRESERRGTVREPPTSLHEIVALGGPAHRPRRTHRSDGTRRDGSLAGQPALGLSVTRAVRPSSRRRSGRELKRSSNRPLPSEIVFWARRSIPRRSARDWPPSRPRPTTTRSRPASPIASFPIPTPNSPPTPGKRSRTRPLVSRAAKRKQPKRPLPRLSPRHVRGRPLATPRPKAAMRPVIASIRRCPATPMCSEVGAPDPRYGPSVARGIEGLGTR